MIPYCYETSGTSTNISYVITDSSDVTYCHIPEECGSRYSTAHIEIKKIKALVKTYRKLEKFYNMEKLNRSLESKISYIKPKIQINIRNQL